MLRNLPEQNSIHITHQPAEAEQCVPALSQSTKISICTVIILQHCEYLLTPDKMITPVLNLRSPGRAVSTLASSQRRSETADRARTGHWTQAQQN